MTVMHECTCAVTVVHVCACAVQDKATGKDLVPHVAVTSPTDGLVTAHVRTCYLHYVSSPHSTMSSRPHRSMS
jgi:hypothetical protein